MKNQLSALIFSEFWRAMDWVFPPNCVGCGEQGYRLCLNCQSKINYTHDWHLSNPVDLYSTRPQSGAPSRVVPHLCADSRHLAYYEGVIRECVHALKYHEDRGLGELMARWLTQLVISADWPIDLVIPVPLSNQRLKSRGYNQSALIAKPAAARLEVSYRPYGLKRVLDTPSQVGLSAEERRRNVLRAFAAEPKIVSTRSILLVDDVMTTGSTLSACANALLNAGATTVYAITIARYIEKSQISSMTRDKV